MYASLHNHTYASNIRLLDAINRPEDLVQKAISLGFRGIAITDHESLSVGVSLLKIRDSIKKDHPDFKIIFGNEIYLIDERDLGNNPKYWHFILWAKDERGYAQLRALSSRAWDRSYVERGMRRCPTTYRDVEEVVGPDRGHLMCATACLGSELAQAVAEKDSAHVKRFMGWVVGVFGKENVRFELQVSDSEEQKAYNAYQIKLSRYMGIPYVITTDSHYLNKEDAAIHRAFLNSKQGDREVDSFYKYTYMMSEEEMREILVASGLTDEEIEEGFRNSAQICDLVEDFDFRHEIIIPKRSLPPLFVLSQKLYAFGDKYPAIKAYYESKDRQDQFLMYQIEQGLTDKKITLNDTILARINAELDILKYISDRLGQPLSAYLNLCYRIIELTWRVSLVACGRGSACGFYINYLLGITQCNPFDGGLWHERFLNKERVEMPDIDFDSQPEKTDDVIAILRQEFGEDNVLNCATFKTESLKSAILTCGRGLGFNNDDMQSLAAMVPSHRGKTYTLAQCLEGDEEQGFDPVPGFESRIKSYPGLLDAVRKIEGLQTNASIHASALYVFNNGYLDHNSLMRAPNGTKITAFNMHDSDDMGALKMDLLRTDAMSKMAKCLDLLLKNGEIEWQGSLKATYDKYLHPDVIEYHDPAMWAAMADGKIPNLFQMETQQGSIAMKKARPTTVNEMGEVNAIMRLQADGEQPIDRYMRFHNNINEWYKEMEDAGLTPEEQGILKKHLGKSYGISGTQETMMYIVMDPQISGFTLGEANALRKAVSKKKVKDIQRMTELFYEKGGKVARREFLEYTFKSAIEPQLGYAFSINHTYPYSVIGLQEANLATKWNPIYWACACLCCNAGNTSQSLDFDEDEESVEEEEETPQDGSIEPAEASQKKKRAAPNYGKIAKAISDAQMTGVEVGLPDINEAEEDFVPDVANNRIIFSLRTVNAVSDAMFDEIMAKRPFSSLDDFMARMETPTPAQTIGLIKAGCFDALEGRPRKSIAKHYVGKLSLVEVPSKKVLTMTHVSKALTEGLIPPGYEDASRMLAFKKWIDANEEKGKEEDGKRKRYVLRDVDAVAFFNAKIRPSLNPSKDEWAPLPGGGVAVKAAALVAIVKNATEKLKAYFNSEEGLKAFNDHMRNSFSKEFWEKHCSGTVAQWEMEQMYFYHGEHELAGVNEKAYGISNFFLLPEEPEMERYRTKSGEERRSPKTTAVAGTVVHVDTQKHLVYLLTLHGVVNVKFYADLFNRYRQTLSTIKNGKKVVLDSPWIKRGEKLLIYGYRREDAFVAKNSLVYGKNRCVCLIEGVHGESLDLRFSRKKDEEVG